MRMRSVPFTRDRASTDAWLVGIFVVVVFMAATLGPGVLALDPAERVALSSGLASQERGLLGRRIALPALALLGIIAIGLEKKPTLGIKGVTGVLMVVALVWFGASVGWALDPKLAARKVIVLVCMWVGALWAATWIRPREFPSVALGTIAIVIFSCVTWEVAGGDFQLLSMEHRFAGLFHPNTTGRYLSVGILAGLMVLSHATGIRRGCCILLLILFSLLLFQTGSRTSVLTLLAGASTVAFLVAVVSKRTAFWLLFWVVGSLGCLVAFVVTGGDLPELTTSAVQMGRERADLWTVTGRIPAWQALLPYVSDRPLIGYGYNAFWTPEHIISMSLVVPGHFFFHAHSGYMDLVLSVGFVGAVLYLSAVLGALLVLSVGFVRSRDLGLLFMVGLLVMLLTGMLTESMNFSVSLPTFFTQIALANAAFVRQYRSPSTFPEEECESV